MVKNRENRDELFEESYLRNKTVEKPGVYTTIIPKKTNHGSFTDLVSSYTDN